MQIKHTAFNAYQMAKIASKATPTFWDTNYPAIISLVENAAVDGLYTVNYAPAEPPAGWSTSCVKELGDASFTVVENFGIDPTTATSIDISWSGLKPRNFYDQWLYWLNDWEVP
jgi:hypothetical protein